MRRREFPVITRLTPISRLLIALRIAQGLTQRELAERPGMTAERAQRTMHALGERVAARGKN